MTQEIVTAPIPTEQLLEAEHQRYMNELNDMLTHASSNA